MDKRKEYEEKMEEETRRMEMKKQRREEKKAEKRGQKREADGDAMEEGSAKREAKEKEEEGRGEKRKAENEGFEEQEEAGGDGMTIEAVLRNDEAWDDVKGGWLDREKVREARMEEVGYMKRKMLWDEVSRSDAWGHRVFSVKLVDTNEGQVGSSHFGSSRAMLFFLCCVCPDRDSSYISLCIVVVVSNLENQHGVLAKWGRKI